MNASGSLQSKSLFGTILRRNHNRKYKLFGCEMVNNQDDCDSGKKW